MRNSRKIIFGLLLILGFIFLSAPALVFAQNPGSEQLTITTYYPSPYGVYKALRFYPITKKSDVPDCSNQEGLVYYYDDGTAPGKLMICGANGNPDSIGGSGWALDSKGNLFTNNSGNVYVERSLGIQEDPLNNPIRPISTNRAYSLDINNSMASLAMGPNTSLSTTDTQSTPMISMDCGSTGYNALAAFKGPLRLSGRDSSANASALIGGLEIGMDVRSTARPPHNEARWIFEATDPVTFKGEVMENNYSFGNNSDGWQYDHSSWVEVTSNERPLAGSTYKSKGIDSINFNNGNIQVHGMPPIIVLKGPFTTPPPDSKPSSTSNSVNLLTDTRPATFAGALLQPEDPGYFCYLITGSADDKVELSGDNNGSMSNPGIWKFYGKSDTTTTVLCVRNELLGQPDPNNNFIPKPNPPANATLSN